MKTTLTFCGFRDAFRAYERMDTFSYEGAQALFEYLEQYEEDTGEELELDVIALCCDYTEESAADVARNYSIDLNDADPENDDYEEQCLRIVRDYLAGNTQLIAETPSGFLYANF
jgi:dGTP triphosphohydrolase